MKRKFLLLIITVLTCMACVLGCAGCTDDEKTDVPDNGNMLTTIFEEWDKELYFVAHYVTGGAGWTDGKVEGYTLEDLASDKLAYNNYSNFHFKWKTNKYKVTKVEFDVTAQTVLKTKFWLLNPNSLTGVNEEINLFAGESRHVTITCDFEKNTDLFCIWNDVSRDVKGTIMWKLTNLYVTAEKI